MVQIPDPRAPTAAFESPIERLYSDIALRTWSKRG